MHIFTNRGKDRKDRTRRQNLCFALCRLPKKEERRQHPVLDVHQRRPEPAEGTRMLMEQKADPGQRMDRRRDDPKMLRHERTEKIHLLPGHEMPGVCGGLMFINIVLGGTQLILLWLKLTESYVGSWWLVLMPSIVWTVGGVILSATKQKGE